MTCFLSPSIKFTSTFVTKRMRDVEEPIESNIMISVTRLGQQQDHADWNVKTVIKSNYLFVNISPRRVCSYPKTQGSLTCSLSIFYSHFHVSLLWSIIQRQLLFVQTKRGNFNNRMLWNRMDWCNRMIVPRSEVALTLQSVVFIVKFIPNISFSHKYCRTWRVYLNQISNAWSVMNSFDK